jgi:ketosteroid isomerase-like protein
MREVDDAQAQSAKRTTAMVGGNINAIAALLDERLIYTHSSGLTDSRDSYIAALNRREYTYHSIETVKTEHSIVEGDYVILNSLMAASITVKSSGQTVSRQMKVTEIWVRRADGYRLIVSHSTNVA